MTSRALVIGGGPAGLMAAEVLAQSGVAVTVCDAKPSLGRKFLMAGKSGLNLTMDEPLDVFASRYSEGCEVLSPILRTFDAEAVQRWARSLGQELFTGSSGRVFPKAMKASPLMRAWLARLDDLGVDRKTRWRWQGWSDGAAVFDTPTGQESFDADVTILALGGASWSRLGSDGQWMKTLDRAGVAVEPFAPSNVGLAIDWTPHMTPHFGSAIKAVEWRAGTQVSRGEATISARGLEGGGVYSLTPALRHGEELRVDLVPDRSAADLENDLAKKPAKLRLAHWLKNSLRLPPAKVALFFEMTDTSLRNRENWVRQVKSLGMTEIKLRPMDEAISTSGGVSFGALTDGLMLKARPGVFCAGEMLAWDAPTGGYLITACLATGRHAANGALAYLDAAA